jgi:hypothetical protein
MAARAQLGALTGSLAGATLRAATQAAQVAHQAGSVQARQARQAEIAGCLASGGAGCGSRIRVAPGAAGLNQDLAAGGVVDKVAAKNPLLAENRGIPKEPEHDAMLAPPTEMTQSFDSIPSAQNVATKRKVRQSKNVSLQEETMEAINFLNMINLRILP